MQLAQKSRQEQAELKREAEKTVADRQQHIRDKIKAELTGAKRVEAKELVKQKALLVS